MVTKQLNQNGTISEMNGNVIEESTEWNKLQYNQASPFPVKFLNSDGTITNVLEILSNMRLIAYKYSDGWIYATDCIFEAGEYNFLSVDLDGDDRFVIYNKIKISEVNGEIIFDELGNDYTRDNSKDIKLISRIFNTE